MTQRKDGDTWLEGFELHGKGVVRTEEKCTECKKTIVAKIDFDVNGNHKIICPHCGHVHCRVIQDGVMTGDRWSSGAGQEWVEAPTETLWSDRTVGIETTSASNYIREKFLQRST